MATKKSPEYKTLREHFHDICDALSRLPNAITPLANDLSSASIISGATRSAVTSTVGVAPYDRASQLLSAAHVTIEYNQHKFYEFADKLVKHDLALLAQVLYQKCESLGGRKAPPVLESSSLTPPTIDLTHPALQAEPSLPDLSNLVAAVIPNKWREVGLQLGLRPAELDSIYDRRNRVSLHCYMDVFELWEKGREPYTWACLIKALSSPSVGEGPLAIQISQGIISKGKQ